MGKIEVFDWLLMRRMSGDHQYYTYAEVHTLMGREKLQYNYTSVWRSMNLLYSDGYIEAVFEGTVLQRTAKFRAKMRKVIQVSGMKQDNNILRKQEQKLCRSTTKGVSIEVLHG